MSQAITIERAVEGNPYVGRGIVVGRSADGKRASLVYFIMGRSQNSRNRVFVEKGDDLIIYPHDPEQLADPSLVIYAPVRALGNQIIVTNGDQTDTIYDALATGGTFEGALEQRCFEPDAPHYTPRISGLLTLAPGDFSYKLSILKCLDGAGGACGRFTFSYPSVPGIGHFIHTYEGPGEPLPTFTGEPRRISLPDNIDAMALNLWESLDPDNKISLYLRSVDLATGAVESRLINKNGRA